MKYVVLLSSGLDSTVNLYAAEKAGTVALAVTFNYSQKAAKKEIEQARKIAKKLKVPHRVIKLDFFKNLGASSLTSKAKLPLGDKISIDDFKTSTKTANAVWVPNRNGIFLNIAAGLAESLEADFIVPGFNLEEAQTFPDNSEEFLQAMDHSLRFSTREKVKTKCFTTRLKKPEIVRLGAKMDVDWSLIWPCYQSQVKWCGQCESCQRTKRAFAEAGINVRDRFVK